MYEKTRYSLDYLSPLLEGSHYQIMILFREVDRARRLGSARKVRVPTEMTTKEEAPLLSNACQAINHRRQKGMTQLGAPLSTLS